MKQDLIDFEKISCDALIKGNTYEGKASNQTVAIKIFKCSKNLWSIDSVLESLDRLKYVTDLQILCYDFFFNRS